MTVCKEGGISVLTLKGRIVFDKESNALREQLKSLISAGVKKIVLDMTSIEHIDGSGLGTLVLAQRDAKTHGASLRLCRLGSQVRKVLEITKLATVFQVCNSDAAAFSNFSGICTEPICPVSGLIGRQRK